MISLNIHCCLAIAMNIWKLGWRIRALWFLDYVSIYYLVKKIQTFFKAAFFYFVKTAENPDSKLAYIQGFDKQKRAFVCEVKQ